VRTDAPSTPARLALAVLAGYRTLLAPLVGGTCRFTPSCSVYATEAIARFGVIHGMRLAVKRLVRCHPFGGWGYDPVPASDGRGRDESGAPGQQAG
jgi:putative membrane protein insertion efficiency factor